MKSKLRLKRWAKVLITVMIIGTGAIIYSSLKNIGAEATTSEFAGVLCIVGWLYLIFGQLGLLIGLWEE